MRFFTSDIEICEITRSTAFEPLTVEITPENLESVHHAEEGKPICSPADTPVYGKLDLQGVDVNEEIQVKFCECCSLCP